MTENISDVSLILKKIWGRHNQKKNIMDRYLLISEHTAEDCRVAVQHFIHYHAGFLTHFDWGCYDNDHHAYAVVEANSHEDAKLAVPPLFRDKTKAIKVVHFKPREGKDATHPEPDSLHGKGL
jgi:hypothetical protein